MGLVIDSYSQISFAPQEIHKAGTDPEVVGIGDVNNDGLNDVVVGTAFYFDPATDYKLYVFLQDNSGNLSAPVIYSYPSVYPGLSCLTIRDVNNDNLKDVVIAYGDTVGVYYQDNSGALNKIKSYYSGNNGNSVDGLSTGDLNYDGLTDIAVSHWGEYEISVLYQKSLGGFSVQNYPAPSGGYDQLEVADINNDQRDDVILMLSNHYNAGIHIFTQNIAGKLDSYVSYFHPNVSSSQESIAVGDINNDGMNDVVVATWGGNPWYEIAIMKQDPQTHKLNPPIEIPADTHPDLVLIDNLNCDDSNEIIVGREGGIKIFEQDENGNYDKYSQIIAFQNTHINHDGISIGDINNDGKKDIVTVCDNYGLVVLINQSTNNSLVQKPQTPTGQSLVCKDNELTAFKSLTSKDDKTHWNLFPAKAGTIITTYKDSCMVLWNNSWRGKAGIYVKVNNICGENTSDTIYIKSNRLPSLNLGNDTTLCANNSLKLHAGKGFSSYLWQNNSTDSAFSVTTGGKYYLNAGNECGNNSDTIYIADVPLPNIMVKDTFICPGLPLIVNVSMPGNNIYHWQDNSDNPLYTITNPGDYTISVTDVNRCHNNKTFHVESLFPPEVLLPKDTSICNPDKLELNISGGGYSYKWQDGSIGPRYTVEQDGTYTVDVTNKCGTVNSSVTVSFINCSTYLDVPTAFSPNDDGLNDILYAVGTNVKNIRFIIYNRWGQKVFESTDLETGWDGTFQGKVLESGVFIFHVSGISTLGSQQIQKHGNVSLIR